MGRILTDPSLYNHVDEAACAIDRIMPRLDRAMADFEVFADKLHRHPESIGIGGAIRPSSGLKEAPVNRTALAEDHHSWVLTICPAW